MVEVLEGACRDEQRPERECIATPAWNQRNAASDLRESYRRVPQIVPETVGLEKFTEADLRTFWC